MNGSDPLTLSVFGVVLLVTLGITYWASRRTRTATEFWAAGRSISAAQNGWALSGEFISASSFLGFVGLMYLAGFDAVVLCIGGLAGFVALLLIVAERMRNAGRYTMADVLAFRMSQRPVRIAAACSTLVVSVVYLVAQMVGAGVLFQALVGIDFTVAVVLTGIFLLVYVLFGGMVATTWIQIVKAGLLMTATVVLTVLVLSRTGWSPFEVFRRAAANHPAGERFLGPGLLYPDRINLISTMLAGLFGLAGLPHILMRFFTVADARAARRSVSWTIVIVGLFYVMLVYIGFGSRAVLGAGAAKQVGAGGNLATPVLAQELGGGAGSVGGDILMAIVSAIAFATILAVVSGLVLAASGTLAHDLWANVLRSGRETDRGEVTVARAAAVGITAVSVVLAALVGSGFNVALLLTLGLAMAASANFPALLLSFVWPRFNTAGAVTGIALGIGSALVLTILSPQVWPGPVPPVSLTNPAIVSIPLGFLGCWLGTMLSSQRSSASRLAELLVRSETGLGAEPGAHS
jgi:cation/acetate symporter